MLRQLLLSPRQTSLTLILGQRLALLGAVVAGWWAWCTLGSGGSPIVPMVLLPLAVIVMDALVAAGTYGRAPFLHAHRLAPVLWGLHKAFHPLRWMLQETTDLLLGAAAGGASRSEGEALQREYLGLVDVGRREGVVEGGEQRLIRRVFEFGDQPVLRVMTPRTDMFTLPLDMDLPEVIRQVRGSGYSRVPVYRHRKDEVVGFLYAKDLLRLGLGGDAAEARSLQGHLHDPFFVPTHMRIDELFREFQKRKLHMALCVDEYGGVAGLVTMEDLLEELFGEIYDEYDLETRQWEAMGDGVYLVSGRMGVEDLEALLQVRLKEPQCHTVAGLVLKHLGHIPKEGEELELKGFRLVVEKAGGTRVHAIRVERAAPEVPCTPSP
jgi:CBS domain containing-hemolysin-like protein